MHESGSLDLIFLTVSFRLILFGSLKILFKCLKLSNLISLIKLERRDPSKNTNHYPFNKILCEKECRLDVNGITLMLMCFKLII